MIRKYCGTCVFYLDGPVADECRRNPPIIVAKPDMLITRLWPEVRPKEDWCGEYKEGYAPTS
jgi:hypothetical protein